MKVYIICKEPFPHGMAATRRITCYAKTLLLGGNDCEVIIYRRSEKDLTVNSEAAGQYQGIPFRYTGASTVKPSHKIPRIISELHDKHALRAYLRKNLKRGDVVIGYVNADMDFICPLIDLIHSKGGKYVRELCEIPFFGNDDGARNKLLSRLFPKCDGFITISDALADVARKYGRKDARIVKIPILVDFEEAVIEDRSDTEEIPFIFHSGTLLEQKDGIAGMIRAFAEAKDAYGKPMKLVLAGNLSESTDKDLILNTIKDCRLEDDVHFTGFLKREQVYDYLSRATAVIINKHDNDQNRYGFSTKLGEYLAAGKAIIISDFGEAMNYLKNGESAWVVPLEDIRSIAKAIMDVFSDRDKRRRIGECGRELCRENFDYRVNAPKMAEFINSL